MEKIEKGLQLLMWTVVVLMVLIFFVTIMFGHATAYDFLFGMENIPELEKSIANNSKVML